MVENPVLFITFVRSDYARISWNAIKKAKPRKLYFYSNKGRKEKIGEIERNEEIRTFIKEIDWDCELHTWFRDECADIYTSLIGAKNWAFENEETLIMLEEDCFASQAFFQYCDHFLKLYKDEMSIGFITGNNYTNNYNPGETDHIISRSDHHFGWATWKNRWNQIDFYSDCKPLTSFKNIRQFYYNNFYLSVYYWFLHQRIIEFVNRTHCWDYIATLHQYKYNQYTVTPIYNLVQNVGIVGTHNSRSDLQEFILDNGESKGDYLFIGLSKEVVADNLFDTLQNIDEKRNGWYKLIKDMSKYYIKKLIKHKNK